MPEEGERHLAAVSIQGLIQSCFLLYTAFNNDSNLLIAWVVSADGTFSWCSAVSAVVWKQQPAFARLVMFLY